MEPVITLRSAGVRFRMWRRNRAHRKAPRLFGSRWRFWGLRDVDLDVFAGERVGVIGSNGAGKTTLMRLIAGIYPADEGEVTVRGRVAPLLSPFAGLHPGLSGWDNIRLSGVLLGLTRREVSLRRSEIGELSGLGDFLDSPARTYSAGMKARLGFASAILCDPDIVLLDEIMAVGDQEFHDRSQAKILELGSGGCTVLLSGHDVHALAECSDRVLWMDGGHVVEIGEPEATVARYLAAPHHLPAALTNGDDSPA